MAIEEEVLDKLLANYQRPEDITGENGLLKQLTKAILERADFGILKWPSSAFCFGPPQANERVL